MTRSLIYTALALTLPLPTLAAEPFELRDGDRVVLIGSTFIEREQRYGYWETRLTARWPARNVIFRNLGWSGDTVFGDAQARFGSPADGFRHRQTHVNALKPTVILVGLGSNEAYEGEPGLPRFLKGLDVLLDSLVSTKARIVILSPLRLEALGRPLPDPTEQNKNVRLYRDALRQVAGKRQLTFVDLFELVPDGSKATPPAPLTDNGVHFTAYGYWRAAEALDKGLGLPPQSWSVNLAAAGTIAKAEGAKIDQVQQGSLRFQVTDLVLPAPAAPKNAPAGTNSTRVLRVRGLAPGKYDLHIDGKPITSADATSWTAGVALKLGPEFDQADKLRKTIVDKNQLYFHRWRPQNETYLFGFRKKEQGQNAKEVPEFDPLIEKLEKEIAKLRVPVAHRYELMPK